LVVTMLAALTLQKSGNSTPRCSKLTEPSRQFVMTTSRRSQATSSYGWTPAVVHTRSTRRPFPDAPAAARRPPRAVTIPFDVLPVAGALDPLVVPSPAIRLAPSMSHGRGRSILEFLSGVRRGCAADRSLVTPPA
jgi:hypothetical protein